MFTGLIEEIGTLRRIETKSGGKILEIAAEAVTEGMKIGDSLAVNGVCLTVVRFSQSMVNVEAVEETISRTTIPYWRAGEELNLERALALGDRMGGHIVQGHVDGIGVITNIDNRGEESRFFISAPDEIGRYLVYKGSIAVDGISLTVAALNENTFSIAVIPHTIKNTNLKRRKIGDKVNLETDILAKYVERLLQSRMNASKIDENRLREMGY